jgi:hypothetical protein
MWKNVKTHKHRHTGAGQYPEAVDFGVTAALDPGLRRGDGVFFDALLSPNGSTRFQE